MPAGGVFDATPEPGDAGDGPLRKIEAAAEQYCPSVGKTSSRSTRG
ncbi:hypothetical protein OG894_44915 (plasmid) [Streptomyces sp. NBC_01724]|nr:hypothetical protein [Streptomyces sp. NBC_01724]